MSLDLPPETGEPTFIESRPKRNYLLRFTFIALLVINLATLILILAPSSNTLTWLTPAQLSKETQPGAFAKLKGKLRFIINPMKRLIYGSNYQKPQINFNLKTFEISPVEASQLHLESPASTNTNGLRAWIFSPAELTAFQQQLKGISDIETFYAPSTTGVDGMQMQMSMGNSVQLSNNSVFSGLIVDLTPRVKNDFLKLLIGVTDREIATLTPSSSSSKLLTNLLFACQVSVPNAGALLINCGSKSNYWLVINPVLVNPDGTPIKR